LPVRLEDIELSAPGSYGYRPLLERIAQHTGAPPECIVTAAGTSMANHLAMAALLEPGDEVLIEQPAYAPLLEVATYLGARLKRLPRRFEEGFAIDPAEVAKQISSETRLLVLTNLHNPSGALIPAATLRTLGELALSADAHVLVDEVYLDMLFETEPPFSFPIGETLADAAENPFIVTSSLTKTYGFSGLRCGWILAAPDLARRIWLLNDLFAANGAHPAERLSVAAFDHLGKFRELASSCLQTNRAFVDAFLEARSDLDCFRPPGGSVVFPRLRRGNAEQFVTLLREKYETSVVPGNFFEMPQHFRLGFAGETAQLHEGLERLGLALDEFARK
jgi:hypothetical protein